METSKNYSYRSSCLPPASECSRKHVIDNDSERKWCPIQEGFPPGFTVDELKKHRKRRPQNSNKPLDNLYVETGSLKALKTEYNRRYLDPPAEYLMQRTPRLHPKQEWRTCNGEIQMAEYKEKFLEFPRERPRPCKPIPNLMPENASMDFTTNNKVYVAFQNVERTKSLRRNTALKPEGDLLLDTETRREFQPHGIVERVRAMKRPTTLKLEGLFESLSSEQKEKYIAYLATRPTFIKRGAQIKLDGDLDFITECREKYVYPGEQTRPPLRKRSTSLKLEGEVDYMPEYQRSFTDLPRSRPQPTRPHGHFQPEGNLDLATEFQSKFLPLKASEIPLSAKLKDSIQLKGDLSLMPEYRDKFIAHGKSKSEIIRKPNNLNLEGDVSYETENIKYSPNFTSRNVEPKHSASPASSMPFSSLSHSEYNSQFVNFPRGRPKVLKPSGNLELSGPIETSTESSQYRSHGPVARTSAKHRPPTLHSVGVIDGAPEYKDKFIEFPVSYNKTPKPDDSLSRDYQSFQVLDALASVENTEPLVASNPSPSYRLEVHNVDDKQGFHRSPERVFPREAVSSQNFASKNDHEAALQAALNRRRSHDQRMGAETHKNSYLGENANEPAFTLLGV